MYKVPVIKSTVTYSHPTLYICDTECTFDHIYLVVVGHLLHSAGYTYLFTCVNHFTHRLELFLIMLRQLVTCS